MTDLQDFSRTLFAAADQLWTNSALRPDQYAQPVLALIALRQMEAKFEAVHAELAPKYKGRLKPAPADYQAEGAIFLPENARFSRLLALPGTADLGAELNAAMKGIADANPDLAGALPQGYAGLPNDVLQELLRLLAPLKIEGDAYGLDLRVLHGPVRLVLHAEGRRVLHARLHREAHRRDHRALSRHDLRPGLRLGWHVRPLRRVRPPPPQGAVEREISIYGVEKMSDTLRLCRMNLAVHGLSGDIREANSYYDDPHKLIGRFDFVMANPPFNQSEVDRAKLVNEAGKVDARFPLGLPTVNNANYLWINLFYAALNPTGRAGFVMANSASDAGGSERELRQKLIETGAVDCIVAVGPNMFFTVTLPVTLWFLDKGKAKGPRGDKVLFVDARHLFRQVTRANRVFDPDHIEFLGNIVRLWRGEEVETEAGSGARMAEAFPEGATGTFRGSARSPRASEIEAQDWSLNPGRYVGVAPGQAHDDEEFKEKLEALQEELEALNAEAAQLAGTDCAERRGAAGRMSAWQTIAAG